MQGAAAIAAGVDPRPGRRLLDRRDRRAARRRSGRRRAARGAREALRADGDADFAARDHDDRRVREARALEVELPGGHGAPDRAGQGRRDDLAELRDDALLRRRPTPRSSAETADLLLGVCVKRSFDRITVDGQLSTNDTVLLQCSGAIGVAVAPGERGRAALRRRRSTRCCASSRC